MVDSNVKLPIGAVAWTRADPVCEVTSACEVGLWKVAHHLLRDGINQIAGTASGRAWAVISGEVIKGNEGVAGYCASERSRIRIPDLTGGYAAQACRVEGAAL